MCLNWRTKQKKDCDVVKNLGKVLILDINDIHRINPKKDLLHKPIIVEFNTVLLKDKILENE